MARSRGEHEAAERHEQLARSSRAAEEQLRAKETLLAGTMEDREQWAKATEDERYLAVAADAELRRRHPEERLEPLRSAEPEPVEADAPVRDELPEWATTLESERRGFAIKLAERQTQTVPNEDPDYEDDRPGLPAVGGA